MTPLYRALLRLYPASFRADYGPELIRTFEESTRHRSRGGALVSALADVIPNAFALHREMLAQDLRYAVRTLARTRGFALAAVLVTALGVGANAATFSVADFVLLRPLPFPDPESLVRLCEGPRTGEGWGCMHQLSPANYRDVGVMNTSFSAMGAFQRNPMNLVGTGEPMRVSAVRVTPEVLPLLGARPVIGRAFDSRTAAGADARTAIIGFDLWQSYFGGDRAVVGAALRLDGTPYVVIGVMPRQFRFPTEDVQVWVPFTLREDDYSNRRNRFLEGVARLGPGVTFERARAELTVIAARLARDHAENAEVGFSFFRPRDEILPRSRMLLLALCGASLSLLLLTCANLANLLLARAASRERELAVRSALGAGRERLMRQLLTESALLAFAGGVAGAIVAAIAIPLLSGLVPPTLPVAAQPTMDWRLLGFAAAFSALTGLGFGFIPALRAGGRTGLATLREGARGGRRTQQLRKVLVTIEVAVSVALLMASGLLIRAMWRVQAVDPGFSAESVLTLQTALPSPRYDDPVRRWDFYRRVTTGIRALPGVESAAYTSGLPLVMTASLTRVVVTGDVERFDGSQNASLRLVTPQFFSTMRIPLLAGRDVSEADTRGRPLVAVISESLLELRT